MADNTLNAVGAAIRAMNDVVIPAVDPREPLAVEQADLVLKTLRLLEEQIPYIRSRALYELSAYAELGRTVLSEAEISPAIHEKLSAALVSADEILTPHSPTDSEIQRTTQRLAGIVTALVRTTAAVDPARGKSVEDAVLSVSERLIAGQTAWFSAQGWETAGTGADIRSTYGAN